MIYLRKIICVYKIYRRLFSGRFFTNAYETHILFDIQILYNKYSFSSFGNGSALTPFFVMCCKIAALHADCKLGTRKKTQEINFVHKAIYSSKRSLTTTKLN